MKKNSIKLFIAAALAMTFTACMNLDPIDPNSVQINSENAFRSCKFKKIFVSL